MRVLRKPAQTLRAGWAEAAKGPRDCWYVYRAPLLSAEVCVVVWVWSSLLTLRQEARRRSLGAEVVGNDPTEFEAFKQLETRKWQEVVRSSGAVVN